MKTDNSATKETPQSRKPSTCVIPLSTSTPSVFWPFEKVDPAVLEALHRATLINRRTETLTNLGEALI